jgi:uncharacterized protein (TIGR02246 family)
MAARDPADVDRLFGEHVNAGDLDRLAALYEPDATFVAQDGRIVTGAAAIRAELGGLVAARPTLLMNVTRVVPAGRDLAVLYNDWRLEATGPDGRRTEMAGRALEVVRRQPDGTWRFVLDDPFARSA